MVLTAEIHLEKQTMPHLARNHSRLTQAAAKSYRHIYTVVSHIPKGRVTTYGCVAHLAGMPGHARLVGYALSALHGRTSIPWHRVVNAKGRVSSRTRRGSAEAIQRFRLEREGVVFDGQGRIPLNCFQWRTGALTRFHS